MSAGSVGEVRARMAERLEDDFPFLFTCVRDGYLNGNVKQAGPLWVFCRALMPIAESLASLCYPGEVSTAKRTRDFMHDQLGKYNPEYKRLASIIYQVWRNSLTHTDEACVLQAKGKTMTWQLSVIGSDHLGIGFLDSNAARFTFSLNYFYQDLVKFVKDDDAWSNLDDTKLLNRYNSWFVKSLPGSNSTTEKGAVAEMSTIFGMP